MAKIIEHGKYWQKFLDKAISTEPVVLVRCPECNNTFLVYEHDCFNLSKEACCECGCKFIPEKTDIIK